MAIHPTPPSARADARPSPRWAALGLAGVPTGGGNLGAAKAEARRLVAVWRKVRAAERGRYCEDQSERFDSHLRERAAARAAGLAIRGLLGLHGMEEPPVVAILDGTMFRVTGNASETGLLDLSVAAGDPYDFQAILPVVSDLDIEEIPMGNVVRL